MAIAGLKDITGSANRFIKVPDFKAIGQKAASLLKKICEEVIIPLKPGASTFFLVIVSDNTSFVQTVWMGQVSYLYAMFVPDRMAYLVSL